MRGNVEARGLLRSEAGSVSIEFGLVGPTFFFLIIAMFELGLTLFTQSALDGAARDAARLIRTGQVQVAADPLGTFKGLLCGETSFLIDCTKVVFDVRTFASFGVIAFPVPDPTKPPPPQFVPGGPSQVVAVRVTYNRPYIIPQVRQLFGDTGKLLVATVVFQNEPFPAP